MSLDSYSNHLDNVDKRIHKEGHCSGCGVQTHTTKKRTKIPFLKKSANSSSVWMPLTNENVEDGTCLRCHSIITEGNLSSRIQSYRVNSNEGKSPVRAKKQTSPEIKDSPARTVSTINSFSSADSKDRVGSLDGSKPMDANEIAIAKAVVSIKFTKLKSNKALEHVKIVSKFMQLYPTSFRVQYAACTQLFAMASEFNSETAQMNPSDIPPVHAAMFRHRVMGLLVQAMTAFISSHDIHPPILGILYTLVRYQKGKHVIREEGGLNALAEVHKYYSGSTLQCSEEIEITDNKQFLEIQKLCCITWANAVASGNKINQTIASKLGALQLILYNMQHSKYDVGLCHYAAGAIANLGFKHSDNLYIIRQENGVQVLENTLAEINKLPQSDFAVSVTNLVQAALDNLEQDALYLLNSEENQESDGSYAMDYIEEAINLMYIHLHSAKVATSGSRLLWKMSAISGQYSQKNDLTTDDVLREMGAVELLIAIIEYHVNNPSVVHLACGAIWNLTSANTRNQEALREGGGLEFLVMILAKYCLWDETSESTEVGDVDVSSSNVISHAMCAISNAVANNIVNQTSMLAIGAIPLIVECMKNYHLKADVQCFALKSLINMSDCHAENSREIVACGGLPFILEAMTSYSHNEEIQACGCLVLNNICYYAKRGFIIALHRSEGLGVLREAADNFPNSCQIYFSEISKAISC